MMSMDDVIPDASVKISVNPFSVSSSETIHDDSSNITDVDMVSLEPAGNLKEPLPFCSEVLVDYNNRPLAVRCHANLVSCFKGINLPFGIEQKNQNKPFPMH